MSDLPKPTESDAEHIRRQQKEFAKSQEHGGVQGPADAYPQIINEGAFRDDASETVYDKTQVLSFRTEQEAGKAAADARADGRYAGNVERHAGGYAVRIQVPGTGSRPLSSDHQ